MMAGVSAPFRHRLRVRYSECDLQGVVFNANYLTYMDEALTELWRVALPGGYAAMVAAGVDLLVAEATVRYRAPARFDDDLELELVVSRLGTTGMTSDLRVLCEGRLLAEGTLRHVFVTAGEGSKTPIPDDVRRGLQPFAA
jgi:acyl-CoA thioester hydrolase